MKNLGLKNLLSATGVYEKKFIKQDEVAKYPQETIIKQDGYTYTINDRGLTDEEVNTALLAKQTLCLQSIKTMVTVVFVMSIVSVVASLLAMFI